MRCKTALCVLLLLICCSSALSAQPLIERYLVVNPLWDEGQAESGETSYVHTFGGWASFGPYLRFQDDDHQWNHQIGGFLEVVRWGQSTSLHVTTQIEFIADPFNNINFNPRAIFWEEGVVLTRRTGGPYWQFGYYHRCKHDIDNLNRGEERTLIYGSFMNRMIWPVDLESSERSYIAWKTDVFTVRQDTREPEDALALQPNVDQKLASTGVQAHTRFDGSGQAGWFATLYGDATLYSATDGFFDRFGSVNDVRFNGGVAAGLSILGRGELRIKAAYEYLSDTGIPVEPRGSHLFRVSLMALSPNVIR